MNFLLLDKAKCTCAVCHMQYTIFYTRHKMKILRHFPLFPLQEVKIFRKNRCKEIYLLSVLMSLFRLQFKWLYRFICAVRNYKGKGVITGQVEQLEYVLEDILAYISLCFGINNHSHFRIHTNTGRCLLVPLRISELKLIFVLNGNASFSTAFNWPPCKHRAHTVRPKVQFSFF